MLPGRHSEVMLLQLLQILSNHVDFVSLIILLAGEFKYKIKKDPPRLEGGWMTYTQTCTGRNHNGLYYNQLTVLVVLLRAYCCTHRLFYTVVTMMKILILAAMASATMAFAPISQGVFRQQKQTTQLYETFGLGIGEDTYENQPTLLRGEQEYKQFVNKYKEDNMLNRKVGWNFR